jgi:hypothetical protein
LETIGDFRVLNCSSVTEIAFPASLTTVESFAAWTNSNLGRIVFPSDLVLNRFSSRGNKILTEVVIGDNAHIDGTPELCDSPGFDGQPLDRLKSKATSPGGICSTCSCA